MGHLEPVARMSTFGESTAESTNQNPTNDDRSVPAIDDGLILEQEGEDDEADIIPTECMLANFFPRSISLVDYPTSVAAVEMAVRITAM